MRILPAHTWGVADHVAVALDEEHVLHRIEDGLGPRILRDIPTLRVADARPTVLVPHDRCYLQGRACTLKAVQTLY